MEQCSGTVKKLSLELGGNAPFIIFDDADIEMAPRARRIADTACNVAVMRAASSGRSSTFRSRAGALYLSVSDCGALHRRRRRCGVELPVALFDAASALAPGNDDADMVRASSLACSGDFLLRLAVCQGKHLIAEGRRAALASSWGCGRSAQAPP